MFQINDHKICPVGLLSLPSEDPKDRTSATLTCGATSLICGAICGCTRNTLEQAGIKVIPWVRGTINEVLEAYQLGQLEKFMMPGCSGRARQNGRCRQNRTQNIPSNNRLKEK
ncbi:NifB/NifX family molybdenum-iron cluster-binding protein [Maridesulfovibrio frigidus]|uniref:NifB/NifX family molybdenum-iron cluster-binding protein n=1 Tax=Maridesulfovibrio frigidus TaxID=340956 RepID=UPI001F244A75|nr:NifB/NifX family molybdenum-iron cluster-binding protein [Maridesulfovibrio frigidus]